MRAPVTTLELFTLLSLSIGKEKPATAYMVAKVMGVNPTTTRLWSLGVGVMDEGNAIKAADLLGLDREFVIFSLEAERKEKAGLGEIAAMFRRAASAVTHAGQAAAVAVLAVLVLGALPGPALAAARLCILCKTRCLPFRPRRRPSLRRILSRSVVPVLVPAQ